MSDPRASALEAALRSQARQLERRVAQQAAVAALGERALEGLSAAELEQVAVGFLAENLDADVCGLFALDAEAELLTMVAGAGLPADADRTWEMRADQERPAAVALRTGEPVVIDDWDQEKRFGPAGGFVSGSTMVVVVKGHAGPLGVLLATSFQAHRFGADDLHFLQSLANVLSDAIERERTEQLVRHQALHDRVTGLPNRVLFLDRLGHALTLGRRKRRDVAVLFLDLDQFKLVNDTLGHAAGDELLAQVAPRLRGAVRPADTVARFGGDEFVLLCEDVGEHEAAAIARRVLAAFAAPFMLGGKEHYLTTSVGVALSRGTRDAPGDLVRDADAAMYRAKERGRGRYELFDEDLRHRELSRMRIESELRRATDRGELLLHYQPMVSLRTGRVRAIEALVRWQHPERGLLSPAEFVPIAEESGLIVPLTRWVLGEALGRIAVWRAHHPALRPLLMAVNVSAADLARPDFRDVVLDALRTAGVPPEALALEVTEAALLDPPEHAIEALAELAEAGCCVTLDDFGTGYSSLSRLEELPVSALKVDRTFVTRLEAGPSGAPMARAIFGLGDALGLRLVAEGVETAAQEAGLRALGCRVAQGYRFSRPVPPGECERLLGRSLLVGA
jgi:diguanylate cyclase (GGDEF)-like protein